jgi:RNA polymerase sigma-70 factor (ECF subfamily)
METRSDQEIITAILGGDAAAFEGLMRRYERIVFKVASSFGNGREDALDISQSTFMKAYRSLGSFRHDSNFKTWLLRIAYNEGINHIRRFAPDKNHTVIDEEMSALHVGATQEKELIDNENASRVRRGLQTLNERHRLAVVLRYLQGLPIAEIADVLRCSEGMVKNILFRGVRTLRKAVAESA